MTSVYDWYSTLLKPAWAPPSWLFGPVWLILYIIIAITYGIVFYGTYTGQIPIYVCIPFILNLVFNFAYTPLAFGLKNNVLAAFDIGLVLITLIWALYKIWPFNKIIVYFNIPHALWVMFATVLQIDITIRNFSI